MSNANTTTYRYLKYYSVVHRLFKQGVPNVTSHNLASLCNVTASQLRKDIMNLSIQGTNKVGYQVSALLAELTQHVNNKSISVVLVGAGSLGTALLNYKNFKKHGFDIKAAFDINSNIGEKNEVKVLHIDHCSNFILKNNIKMAILTVPESVAQHTAKLLVDAGIDKILNLTPAILSLTPDVTVSNVNLVFELEYLLLNSAAGSLK